MNIDDLFAIDILGWMAIIIPILIIAMPFVWYFSQPVYIHKSYNNDLVCYDNYRAGALIPLSGDTNYV